MHDPLHPRRCHKHILWTHQRYGPVVAALGGVAHGPPHARGAQRQGVAVALGDSAHEDVEHRANSVEELDGRGRSGALGVVGRGAGRLAAVHPLVRSERGSGVAVLGGQRNAGWSGAVDVEAEMLPKCCRTIMRRLLWSALAHPSGSSRSIAVDCALALPQLYAAVSGESGRLSLSSSAAESSSSSLELTGGDARSCSEKCCRSNARTSARQLMQPTVCASGSACNACPTRPAQSSVPSSSVRPEQNT